MFMEAFREASTMLGRVSVAGGPRTPVASNRMEVEVRQLMARALADCTQIDTMVMKWLRLEA